jgi:FMN phosphatase YigB (HAD superfamily)
MLEFFRQSDTYHQGRITDKEFYQQACELLEVCTLNQTEFYNAFNSIIAGLNLDMVELIRKIKSLNNLKIVCMSNINSSHWTYLKKQKWNIWELFDEFILSHEIHSKPEEIIFIDDGFNNVRSARVLGINSIRFIGLDNLIEEIQKFEVKVG